MTLFYTDNAKLVSLYLLTRKRFILLLKIKIISFVLLTVIVYVNETLTIALKMFLILTIYRQKKQWNNFYKISLNLRLAA